ncbi:MAG: hypothetical protein WD552_02250 [Candidatus Paceibacterota bacterium]
MTGGNIQSLIASFGGIISSLIPVVASIALLAFFWGLAKYIFQAGSEEEKGKGKQIMIAGIVSLFLIAAIGGIIDVLGDILGVNTGENITPPSIEYNGGDGTR